MTCSPEQHKLDEDFMREALKLAQCGMRERQQWPVGAVLVYQNEIVARAYNYVLGGRKDWFGHAELRALRKARAILRKPMDERWTMTLYTTLEPCTMCFGAAMESHIGRIVFGLEDPEGETLLPPRLGDRNSKRPGYQRPDVEPYILRQDSADLFQEYLHSDPPPAEWRLKWPRRLAAQTLAAQTKDTLVSFRIMIEGQTTSERVTAATANPTLRGHGAPLCTLCETGTLQLAKLDQAARG